MLFGGLALAGYHRAKAATQFSRADRPRRIHPCGEAGVKVARRAGRVDHDPEVLARLDDGS
jgi:hypothetical protein